jgi:hypothetical protein
LVASSSASSLIIHNLTTLTPFSERRVFQPMDPMTRMKNTNESSSMLRLPLEILVRIITLVQRSQAFIPWPDAYPRTRPPLIFPTGALGYDIYDVEWHNVMLVCSHIRVIALHSPALWSYIDTRWPRTKIDLCVSRALPHPLQIRAHVFDGTSSLLATRLLHHARDAEISFEDPAVIHDPGIAHPYEITMIDDVVEVDISPTMWRALCQRLLNTASQLRSLTIRIAARSDWVNNHALRLVPPILGGQRSLITRLDLDQVHIMDPPDLPYLIHLLISSVIPPPNEPMWLIRWLSATPNLRVLNLCVGNRPLAVPAAPVYLPRLSNLIIFAPLAVAVPILATIPPPDESLVLDLTSGPGETLDAKGEEATAARLHAFVWRCKEQIGRHAPLPSTVLDIHQGSDQSRYLLGVERLPGTPWLQLDVECNGMQATGPFLTEVVRCTLRVQTLRDIDWAELLPLTALKSLRICTKIRVELAETGSVQEWVDTRARTGCAVGLVEIMHEPQIYQGQHIRVVWKPAECRLAEAAWAA